MRAAPGVRGVWSAADLPDMPDCSPSTHDEPPATGGKGALRTASRCFWSRPKAIWQARKAARLGKMEIMRASRPADAWKTPLPPIRGLRQGPVVWTKGDPGSAIASAPFTRSGEMEVGGQEHFYLEGQIAAALPGEDGMHVYSSTQHPTEIQHKVAHALHLPMAAVRVETRRMGGGFGGKESQGNALAIACAWVARATGLAAKMRYDRDDDMMITGKRHDLKLRYRLGHDGEGRILGLEFTHLFRCGWSQDLSLPVADRAMLHADNCYHLPDIRIESHRLRTNTQSATAFRGFGGPQGMIGIERVLDHLAFAVGRDPLEVRRLNFYRNTGPKAPAPATALAPPIHRPTRCRRPRPS